MFIPGIVIIITATCWIIYELLLSTLSSYLLWNSILQFSLTIGFFLLGLWIWSFLAKFIKNYEKIFIIIETILAIIWWGSIILIKWIYLYLINYLFIFQIFYLLFVVLIWILIWLEIPLIWIFLNKKYQNFQKTIWNLLSLDYIGSLIGTILFPVLLLPWLWLTYTAIAVWIFNLIVSIIFIIISSISTKEKIKFLIINFLGLILLLWIYLFGIKKIEKIWDHFFYWEPIVYSTQSPYQKIVITQRWNDIRLYLNWHLQFLSLDERRYHTSLTYFAKKFIENFSGKKLKILILWWGDWLAVRNLLECLSKKKNINYQITIVDLDPYVTNLAKNFPLLVKLNKNSLNNPHIKIINQDAFKFLLQNKNKYHIIIADFPDPRNIELAKLYSTEFYSIVINHLKENGIFTTQASNAFFSKEAFWSIYKTINFAINKKGTTFKVVPYHTYIPSFGDWWFVSLILWNSVNFYTWTQALSGLINFQFDKDYIINLQNIKINSIENPIIIQYYVQWYKRFSQ